MVTEPAGGIETVGQGAFPSVELASVGTTSVPHRTFLVTSSPTDADAILARLDPEQREVAAHPLRTDGRRRRVYAGTGKT